MYIIRQIPLLLSATNALSIGQRASSCQSAAGDAPFSLPCSTYANSITCPRGIQGKKGGVVLLVHGTGSTGSESWEGGPYNLVLPGMGPEFDICWIDLPNRSLTDAQISSEYIAYNIPILAKQSATGKVSMIGHSQGAGLNPQWALLYWPSTRKYIQDYVALAPDFHGTAEGPLLCTEQNLLQNGCSPSVIQQSVGSKYLKAQNKRGGEALVDTTSVYTLTDDVIQPEIVNPTSYLSGASVISIQSVCGPAYLTDHFTMIVNAAAFAAAYDALTHDGPASRSRLSLLNCTLFAGDMLPTFESTVALVTSTFNDVIALGGDKYAVRAEPALKPYVCSAGDAKSCAKS